MSITRWIVPWAAALAALAMTASAQDGKPRPGPKRPGPAAHDVATDDAWVERWARIHMLGKLPNVDAEVLAALSDADADVAALAGESLARATALTPEQMQATLSALRSAPTTFGAARAASAQFDVDADAVAEAFAEIVRGEDRKRYDGMRAALDALGEDVPEPIVIALAEILGADDEKARMRAAQTLESCGRGAAPATEALCALAATGGAGWDVRAAARALGTTGVVDDRVLRTLDECTRSKVKWLRDFARDGLARIGPPAEDVLLEMSTRGDFKERRTAASVLGSTCPTEKVVAHARGLLEDGDIVDVQLGLAICDGLGTHGATLKDALEPHLDSTIFQLRIGAANALLMTDVSHEAASDVLLDELGETDAPERMRSAFFALQGIAARAPNAGTPLVSRMLADDDPQARAIGLHLASSLEGDFAARLAPRVGRLAQRDESPEVSGEALSTLRGWGPQAAGAEPFLAAIVSSDDETSKRRAGAARVLGALDTVSPETAKTLEIAARDEDESLRRVALRAVRTRPESAALLRAITDGDDAIAATIAWVGLAVIAPDETESHTQVLAALRDENPRVRAEAAAGVRLMPNAARLPEPALLRLTRDPDERVAREARESVRALYGVTME